MAAGATGEGATGAGAHRAEGSAFTASDAGRPVVVRCRVRAEGADPLRVLLLHGLAGSATSWEAFATRVAPGVEVWVADLPWRGEGVGAWAQRPDVGHWAAAALGSVPGRVDVVMAHSFAANVFLEYLDGLDPGHGPGAHDVAGPLGSAGPLDLLGLRGMVLVSPFYRGLADDFDWETISYYLNDFDRILAEGIRVRSRGGLDPEIRRGMAVRVRDRVGPYGWTRFFDTYLRTPLLRTGRLTRPCLVIGGETDFASPAADSLRLAAALPQATAHIFLECGHFAMVEKPDRFADLVNEFIRSTAGGPPARKPDENLTGATPAEYPVLELNR